MHLGRETVSALVDSLNALLRFKPGAQRRKAFGDAVRGDVNLAPEFLCQLLRGDYLARMGQQEPERRKLFRRQMDDRVSTVERAIRFETETSKRESKPGGIGRDRERAVSSYTQHTSSE